MSIVPGTSRKNNVAVTLAKIKWASIDKMYLQQHVREMRLTGFTPKDLKEKKIDVVNAEFL